MGKKHSKHHGSMNYDEKERLMIAHYFGLLAENNFTEYDILGFLMVLRQELDSEKYKYIYDFANLIAHRSRDQGIAMDAIQGAIDNGYKFIDGTTKIRGYHGIPYDKWVSEWKNLATDFSKQLSDETIHDITICVFSLAQNTAYSKTETNDGVTKRYSGKMDLFGSRDRELMLGTAENEHSLSIWFASTSSKKLENLKPINATVETFRKDGVLYLGTIEGTIIF